MSHRLLFLIVLASGCFISMDSSPADRQPLTDGELDRVTATGPSKNNPPVGNRMEEKTGSRPGVSSQANVSSVVLNNVVGKNLVANGVNVSANPNSPVGR